MSADLNDEVLIALQNEIAARLRAEPLLSTVSILLERDGDPSNELYRLLSTVYPEEVDAGLKPGAAIVVTMPVIKLDKDSENVPGPPANALMKITIHEDPIQNLADQGTGIAAEKIAVRVLNTMHLYRVGGISGVLSNIYGSQDAALPLPYVDGVRGYLINLRAKVNLGRASKTATPRLSIEPDGEATITCATADSTIYWTVDGSPPFPGNDAATEYAGVIDLEVGETLRAAAIADDYQPSDSTAETYL